MRFSQTLALLGVFAGGSAARAAEPAPAPDATVQQAAAPAAAPTDSLPVLGIMTDVGLPDGAAEQVACAVVAMASRPKTAGSPTSFNGRLPILPPK